MIVLLTRQEPWLVSGHIQSTLPTRDWEIIGPSGVCALPLGVRRQMVVVIVLGVIFSSFSLSSEVLNFLPEWIVIGFRNFAWAPK